ncbi:MAG: hypothetical protein HY547_00145 [Elusimicrobia bacterium]|nr:hypothetical protein [Elusimicrobiota bacterium]
MSKNFYRSFYDAWLAATGQMSETLLRHPVFLKAAKENIRQAQAAKKKTDAWFEAALKKMSYPTLTDFDALAKKAHDLERRVRALERQIK